MVTTIQLKRLRVVSNKKMELEGSPSESPQHNLIRATRVYDKRRLM